MSAMQLARTVEVVFYVVYLAAALVLVKNKRVEQLFQLITCSLLGVSLELFSVNIFKTYHYYPHFFVNLGDAAALKSCPLWVGLGWGLLMPLAIVAGKKLSKKPIVVGLVAYVIVIGWDLIWDVIAIRTSGGLWVWRGTSVSLTINLASLYGIPWMNYLGYSAAIVPLTMIMAFNDRKFAAQANNVRRFWFAILNYLEGLVSFIVVVGIFAVIYNFVPAFAVTAFLLLFGGTLIYMLVELFAKHRFNFLGQFDWAIILEFGLSYLVSLFMGFYLGLFQDKPWLVVVHIFLMLVTLAFGVLTPKKVR
ncbi:hypothetical protein LFYK43_12090 [Ligilactobacillus salitolerans]|uniref:Uncharacterized protein n=1 Tax=Ligilactobacillus salitolerans TaxID=1808352 RepID=A0A401IT75_9LACO|nr:hypothetical protein [Ligilactobacillus salitolerans]GBG94750.1 hypothetical protein LFYK43_12090 [Ligilactobacillus salitolerans]